MIANQNIEAIYSIAAKDDIQLINNLIMQDDDLIVRIKLDAFLDANQDQKDQNEPKSETSN